MVLITANKRMWLLYMAVSLVLFAVIYFVAIRPGENTANQALKTGEHQAQQVINQAQQQLSQAGAAAASQPAASNAAVQSATNAAQQTLNNASKLTSCVSAAGTDTSKLAACQSKYGQ